MLLGYRDEEIGSMSVRLSREIMDAHSNRESRRAKEIANIVALLANASSHGRLRIRPSQLLTKPRKGRARGMKDAGQVIDEWEKLAREQGVGGDTVTSG